MYTKTFLTEEMLSLSESTYQFENKKTFQRVKSKKKIQIKTKIINLNNQGGTPSKSEKSNSTKSNTLDQSSQLSPNTNENKPSPTFIRPKLLQKQSISVLNSIYQQIINEDNSNNYQDQQIPNFQKQKDINEIHRGIVIDWLINVHLYFQLSEETLFLTVKLMDSFLARVENFTKNNFQLLGLCSLLIASKYIESFHLNIDNLVLLCEKAYSNSQIINFEKKLLFILDYTIIQDNLLNFFDLLSMIFKFDTKDYYLGKFLLELTLLDTSFNCYKRTLIALSASYLVMKIHIQKHPDYKQCLFYVKEAKCSENDMKFVGKKILVLMNNVKSSGFYFSCYQKYLDKIKEDSVENDENMMMIFEKEEGTYY